MWENLCTWDIRISLANREFWHSEGVHHKVIWNLHLHTMPQAPLIARPMADAGQEGQYDQIDHTSLGPLSEGGLGSHAAIPSLRQPEGGCSDSNLKFHVAR